MLFLFSFFEKIGKNHLKNAILKSLEFFKKTCFFSKMRKNGSFLMSIFNKNTLKKHKK